jgi:integrase
MGKAVQPIKNEDLELDLLEYLMANDERMYMFYLILRYTGFRASDVLPIKVRDIQGNRLIIREKKTENRANKEHSCYEVK